MPVSDEKQYEVVVGLYKFHLEQLLKFSAWVFLITGAILSYYFLYKTDLPSYGFFILLFPLALNFGFFIMLDGSHGSIDIQQRHIEELCKGKQGEEYFFPDFSTLNKLIVVFSILSKMVSLALILLLAFESRQLIG